MTALFRAALPYLIGAAIVAAVFLYGRHVGVSAGRVQQLEATVKAERDRKNVDAGVRRLGDYDLCVRAGGLPNDCQQLRGLDATAGGK